MASSSQSRYSLLKKNNLCFIKIKPICNEDIIKKTLLKKKRSPKTISLELARIKARSVSLKKTNILVVGSDTVISIGGLLLDKAKNIKNAKTIQEIISTPFLKVFTSTDILGVELGGALKNVIAIATGICDGLNLGFNTRAALITRGLVEIARIGTESHTCGVTC